MERMTENEELPGVLVVIFIAGGVLGFLFVFIFGKRQIQRFALKNQKGPHVPVGLDARKSLKREIERRLDRTADIFTEPVLVHEAVTDDSPYYYRMRALDDVRNLELEILECTGLRRPATDTTRRFLMSLRNGPLAAAGARAIHELCDRFELARHDPAPFQRAEYDQLVTLQRKLISSLHTRSEPSSMRSTPRRPGADVVVTGGRRPTTLSVRHSSASSGAAGTETPL